LLKRKYRAIISIALCFSLVFGNAVSVNSSSFFNSGTETQATKETAKVRVLFTLIFEDSSIFSGIIGLVWYGTKVTIKGYEGNFTEIVLNDSKETGYILSFCHGESSTKLLVRYANIFMDQTRNILKDYDNPEDFSWFVSKDGIISIDKNTGVVTPINPGTVVVTAKYNGKSSKCVVSAINRWENQETAKAKKDVVLKSSPANSNYTVYDVITVSKDTEIIAVGDTAQASGQVYVKIENGDKDKYGHIKLSDFSGIDYMMFQYHYFDNGYKSRFKDDGSKIIQYASVLDDVMMANFGLKVCYYIEPYTSAADKCKKLKYGDDYLDYLSGSCPKTGKHNTGSCLRTIYMRDVLLEDKGWGTNVITKAVWTGHIMDGHVPSNSESVSQTMVFTTANTVSYSSGTYSNKSSSDIRYYSLYEITHETGHQLGLDDGYCYKDIVNGKCSNKNCFTCRKLLLPNCIMAQIKSPTNSTNMFCDDCKEKINSHLKDHH